jgi:hypothetical protein
MQFQLPEYQLDYTLLKHELLRLLAAHAPTKGLVIAPPNPLALQ